MSNRKIIMKCTHCDNNITISEARFPFVNDFGRMVIECGKCGKASFAEVKNPEESYVASGGEVTAKWDRWNKQTSDFDNIYPGMASLGGGMVVIGDAEDFNPEFDYGVPHIHVCSECDQELETISRDALALEKKGLERAYKTVMDFALGQQERDDLVVESAAVCTCGKDFKSYWHLDFIADNKPLDFSRLLLIGTDMGLKQGEMDGIHSKDHCKKLLEKCLIRWNAIFPKILVVTPFIGHQYTNSEGLNDLWEWMKQYMSPEKTSLVTRTANLTAYKKSSDANGISIEVLEDYGIASPIITGITKKQNFHSKIYVGYSDTEAEILMGSFNLVGGPSMENISFSKQPYKKFEKRFIDPLKIKIDDPGQLSEYCFFLKKMADGTWGGNETEIAPIISKL